MQTYDLGDAELWHADLYRLAGARDIAELGLDEAFGTAISLVEWADRLGGDLPGRALALAFDFRPGRRGRPPPPRFRPGSGWDWLAGGVAETARDPCRTRSTASSRAQGWAGARRSPLAGDASARRYERVARGGARAIVMDVPPDSGLEVRPFLAVTGWLRAAGLSAPEVLAADRRRGLCCWRILAMTSSRRLCVERAEGSRSSPRRGRPARRPPATPAAGRVAWTPPPYDLAFLLREVRLVARVVPAGGGRRARPRPTSRPSTRRSRDRRPRAAGRRWHPGAARLSRGEPHLAAGPRRARPCRHARLPGHADRAPRVRSRLAAGGRPTRHRAGLRAAMLARYLGPLGRRPEAFTAAAACAGGAAQPEDPRALHPALPARRQAAVPSAPAAGLGASGAANSAIRRWRRSPPSSPGTSRLPGPAVRAASRRPHEAAGVMIFAAGSGRGWGR